jgi:hypothetical protein
MTKIVVIGGSITDGGCHDVHVPYGDGYMGMIRLAVDDSAPDPARTWRTVA